MPSAGAIVRLKKSPWALPAIALVLGLAARLFLAIAFYGNFDQDSYDLVAGFMLRGQNIYVETARYNYTPAWAYILEALARIAIRYQIQFHIIVRGFLAFVDLGVAAAIGLVAARIRPGTGRIAFTAYFLNPVAILLVGFHGQFENLAALPMLLALYVAEGKNQNRSATLLIWLLGTAALVTKHIVVFTVWMLFVYVFTERRYRVAMGFSVLVFLLSFTPFLPSGLNGIIRNVFLYGGLTSPYGTGLLPAAVTSAFALFHHATDGRLGAILIGGAKDIDRLLLLGMMGTLPFFAKRWLKLSLVEALELSAVALLSVIYLFGEQYFILPIIFGSIRRSRPYIVSTVLITILLLASPVNVYLLHVSLPELIAVINVAWLSLLAWFGTIVVQSRKRATKRDEQTVEDRAVLLPAL